MYMGNTILIILFCCPTAILADLNSNGSIKLGSSHKHNLTKEYKGASFFDEWTFWTGTDPAWGYVNYVDEQSAKEQELIKVLPNGSVYIGVNYKRKADPRAGRDSVRITSSAVFNYGLYIIRVSHIPVGCGTWSAFWMLGRNGRWPCQWPYCGELDIIEGTHLFNINIPTIHTGTGCDYTGHAHRFVRPDCASPEGCSEAPFPNSFGIPINVAGGGVWAVRWFKHNISYWHWNMTDVPPDAQSLNPLPLTWGPPLHFWDFGPWCPASSLKNAQFVLNIDFCDTFDWSWKRDCMNRTGYVTCPQFVRDAPASFQDAYWIIDYLRIFDAEGPDDTDVLQLFSWMAGQFLDFTTRGDVVIATVITVIFANFCYVLCYHIYTKPR